MAWNIQANESALLHGYNELMCPKTHPSVTNIWQLSEQRTVNNDYSTAGLQLGFCSFGMQKNTKHLLVYLKTVEQTCLQLPIRIQSNRVISDQRHSWLGNSVTTFFKILAKFLSIYLVFVKIYSYFGKKCYAIGQVFIVVDGHIV